LKTATYTLAVVKGYAVNGTGTRNRDTISLYYMEGACFREKLMCQRERNMEIMSGVLFVNGKPELHMATAVAIQTSNLSSCLTKMHEGVHAHKSESSLGIGLDDEFGWPQSGAMATGGQG
jgi:hypothetical protein